MLVEQLQDNINVFVGCSAGDCVTSGCDNVYLGRGAGKCVTTAR